jgi:hypothetical protein
MTSQSREYKRKNPTITWVGDNRPRPYRPSSYYFIIILSNKLWHHNFNPIWWSQGFLTFIFTRLWRHTLNPYRLLPIRWSQGFSFMFTRLWCHNLNPYETSQISWSISRLSPIRWSQGFSFILTRLWCHNLNAYETSLISWSITYRPSSNYYYTLYYITHTTYYLRYSLSKQQSSKIDNLQNNCCHLQQLVIHC